jgi:hypothetical protein
MGFEALARQKRNYPQDAKKIRNSLVSCGTHLRKEKQNVINQVMAQYLNHHSC